MTLDALLMTYLIGWPIAAVMLALFFEWQEGEEIGVTVPLGALLGLAWPLIVAMAVAYIAIMVVGALGAVIVGRGVTHYKPVPANKPTHRPPPPPPKVCGGYTPQDESDDLPAMLPPGGSGEA